MIKLNTIKVNYKHHGAITKDQAHHRVMMYIQDNLWMEVTWIMTQLKDDNND